MAFSVLRGGKLVDSAVPGEYAGHKSYRIFGTLDCSGGKQMKSENRVFFATLEDAVNEGYRPCKICKPMGKEDFATVKHLVPFKSLQEFYDRGKQLR